MGQIGREIQTAAMAKMFIAWNCMKRKKSSGFCRNAMARHNGLHNFLDFLDILLEFLSKNCYSQNIPTVCLVWGLDTYVKSGKA